MIVVEGKYDKIKLESLIDGMIITTDGFRIFRDRKKQEMIRKLARKNGLIVLTDSDVAGFQIRNLIRSIAPDAEVRHVYIPQIAGKEKRKAAPSKEGTLGVEGLDITLLRRLLEEQGVIGTPKRPVRPITKMDFLEDGLSGGENSAEKRRRLMQKLDLPPYLSAKALLQVLNELLSYEEYRTLITELSEE